MNFDLNEDQSLLRDLVERFVADRYDAPRRLAYVREPRGFSANGWAFFADAGLLALPVTTAHGGLDGGTVELITVAEALGRAVATEPFLAVSLMATSLFDRGASEAQWQARGPAMLAGTVFPALACLERDGRFSPERVTAKAVRRGGDTLLEGEKCCVLGGGFADVLLVSAVGEGGELGIYAVDAGAAELQRVDYRLVDGSVASDFRFFGAPAELLPDGARALEGMLDRARLAIVAELVGLMSYMFEATLDYVKTRRQFGQPIGSFQAVQHRLADGYAMLELSRSQLYRAAGQAPDTPAARAAIIGAKAYASANAVRIAEEAVQLHGGIGTTEELLVGQAFKRTMLLATLLGDSEWDLRQYTRLRMAA